MTVKRNLLTLKWGEKVIVRHSAGGQQRITNEFVFEGGNGGRVIWRKVNPARRNVAGRALVLTLTVDELKSCDEFLEHLRRIPKTLGTITADHGLVLEWFEGIRLQYREEFPHAELDEHTKAIFFGIIQRLNLEMAAEE